MFDKAVNYSSFTLSQIGMVTLDNASNCRTMKEGLEKRLRAEGIAFDAEQNRIRCVRPFDSMGLEFT